MKIAVGLTLCQGYAQCAVPAPDVCRFSGVQNPLVEVISNRPDTGREWHWHGAGSRTTS